MKDRLKELLRGKSIDQEVDVEYVADFLLSEGVIVPPCKVGDVVYIVVNPYSFLPLKKAVEGEVVSIHLHEHGLFLRVLFDTKKINGCADYNLNWRLGKDLYLTRAEAEKALAERSENEKGRKQICE